MHFTAVESGGFIWFSRDPNADFGDVFALAEDMDAFGMSGLHLYRRRTHEVASNWKQVMDAFLESYHVQRLHAETIAQFFTDGIAVADLVGPHQRAVVGRADYLSEVDPEDWAAVRRVLTYTYAFFPTSILIVSPDYINLLVVMPKTVGTCLVEDFMLIPEPPRTPEAEAHWERSWTLLDGGTFEAEDFRAAALCQRGIESGMVKTVTVGALEEGIAAFHQRLEKLLYPSGTNSSTPLGGFALFPERRLSTALSASFSVRSLYGLLMQPSASCIDSGGRACPVEKMIAMPRFLAARARSSPVRWLDRR
jgi:Rieske 2Fe-2S family protein